MKQLILQEFKKLLKKKYLLILLFLLLITSGSMTYNSYSNNYNGDYYIQDNQGVKQTGIDALRYIDRERHKLAGVVDEKFIDNYLASYHNEIDNYIKNDLAIDEAKMIATYGENYETLLERGRMNTLTDEDWDIISQSSSMIWHEPDGEYDGIYFNVYYKNTGKLSAISSIYNHVNEYFFPENILGYYKYPNDTNEDLYLHNELRYSFQPLIDKEKFLAKKYQENPVSNEVFTYLNFYGEEKVNPKILDYYDQKFMEITPYFDSTIPNQFLINNMTNPFGIILLILLIIVALSDIFSYDSQTKSDQIIECSPYGYKKLKSVKVIVGVCCGLGIVILQQVLIFIICNILLPIRDFSLVKIVEDNLTNNIFINYYIERYGNVLISGILMMTLGAIVVSMLTMFISYLSKNKFVTAIVMIIITFVLTFGIESYVFADISRIILPYIPFHFMRFTLFHNFVQFIPFSIGIIPHTVLFDHVVAIRDIVIVVWLVVCCLMALFISKIKVSEVKSK